MVKLKIKDNPLSNIRIILYYCFGKLIAQVALFLAPCRTSIPFSLSVAMTLSTVRLDSPVLDVIEAMVILGSAIINCMTAISFRNNLSFKDIGVSETSFWRLVSSKTLSWRNGSVQRICSVRLRRSAGIQKTVKFINRSNGSNVR